jgi:hypothetical protein
MRILKRKEKKTLEAQQMGFLRTVAQYALGDHMRYDTVELVMPIVEDIEKSSSSSSFLSFG